LRETLRENDGLRERERERERETCRPKRRKKRTRDKEEMGFLVMGPYEVKSLVLFIFS
jgi:hypothetical protein